MVAIILLSLYWRINSKLLRKIRSFLLGDYIDRGLRNREVLEYILELIAEDYFIFHLMGNHEYFILRDFEFSKLTKTNSKFRDLISSKDLLNHKGELDDRFFSFIEGLPYYYELDDFILVHAGLDFNIAEPLTDRRSMIYARNFDVDLSKIHNKTLIHGHTPIGLDKIKSQVENYKTNGCINLDNGCVYYHYEGAKEKDLGRLCCLNLDTMELICVDNMD